ncbi:hypothetical protein [Luteipulveratus mongoliensis]|uniref:Uncharacterized protein n=1 Tax=Luteipulveratus mongoliensis TaxID=571913 RepID=A0A0K1JGW1_9MICO|nr:hypothetical protein [Luteipulveratus mongoliensis]AKU15957.1 hypothetical protein VV02_08985 [Luteipulveratus mongoliensis]
MRGWRPGHGHHLRASELTSKKKPEGPDRFAGQGLFGLNPWLRAVVLAGALLSCGALVALARSEEIEPGIWWFIAGSGLVGIAIAADFRLMGDADQQPPIGRRVALIAALELIVGVLAFPLSLGEGDPDYSYFGVLAALVLLVGLGATLLGVIVVLIVLRPVGYLLGIGAQGAELRAGRLIALVVLPITPLAVGIVLGSDSGSERGRATFADLLPLVGVGRDGVTTNQAWLWLARICLVWLVVAVVLLRRQQQASPEASPSSTA